MSPRARGRTKLELLATILPLNSVALGRNLEVEQDRQVVTLAQFLTKGVQRVAALLRQEEAPHGIALDETAHDHRRGRRTGNAGLSPFGVRGDTEQQHALRR
jgi:hypothetical protein